MPKVHIDKRYLGGILLYNMLNYLKFLSSHLEFKINNTVLYLVTSRNASIITM